MKRGIVIAVLALALIFVMTSSVKAFPRLGLGHDILPGWSMYFYDLAPRPLSGKYAILVGIWDYPGEEGDLPDFTWLEDELEGLLESCGYTVIRLDNEAATYDAVSEAIRSMPTQEDCSVFFYFCGHGVLLLSGLESAICLYDAPMSCSEIGELFSQVKSKKTLLVFDSCFAGDMEDFFRGVTALGRVVVTSTSDLTLGFIREEDGKGYSIFSKTFIECLEVGKSVEESFKDAWIAVETSIPELVQLPEIDDQYPGWMFLDSDTYNSKAGGQLVLKVTQRVPAADPDTFARATGIGRFSIGENKGYLIVTKASWSDWETYPEGYPESAVVKGYAHTGSNLYPFILELTSHKYPKLPTLDEATLTIEGTDISNVKFKGELHHSRIRAYLF